MRCKNVDLLLKQALSYHLLSLPNVEVVDRINEAHHSCPNERRFEESTCRMNGKYFKGEMS